MQSRKQEITEREAGRRARQAAASATQPDPPSRFAERPITVTVNRAAEISGLGVSTIWKMIAEGKLATTSVGRRRLVFFESLERLLGAAA